MTAFCRMDIGMETDRRGWSRRCSTAAPEAAGKRFLAVADGPTLSYLEVAETLRRRLGSLAAESLCDLGLLEREKNGDSR